MTAPSTLERPDAPSGVAADAPSSVPPWRRPAVLAVGLFAVLFVLGLLTSPDGYLSTDTGGKTAAVVAMDRNGGVDLDLGYWAESVDPDGSLYPMFSTKHFDDGGWVNVTSLPMLLVAKPLYQVAGMRGALILPILGAVFAALAAGALARRLFGAHAPDASPADRAEVGAVATVAVGLAGPVTIYALDFWEHSIGLALMGWAMVGLHDALERSSVPTAALAAAGSGAAFGVAATMRQEALVYGFAAGCVLFGFGVVRRRTAGVVPAAAMALGALVPLAANAALEAALLGSAARAERGLGTAAAVGSDAAERLEEAVITGLASGAVLDAVTIGSAALFLVGLLGLATAEGPRRRQSAILVAVGLMPLALDLAVNGLRFVPGMLFATPLAGLGLAALRRPSTAMAPQLTAVLAATPLVWAVQYTGGAGPQWAGRYILLTGFVLTVCAVARFWADRREVVLGIAAAGLAVTAAGVVWTVQRSHAFADFTAELAEAPEDVLVFSDPFVSREAGPLVLDERWLAAWTDERRVEAADALADLDVTEFGYVQRAREDAVTFPGYSVASERTIPLFEGYDFRVVTFVAD